LRFLGWIWFLKKILKRCIIDLNLIKKEGIQLKFLSKLLDGLVKSQERTAKKIIKSGLYY
jgi:hypothetical protein